MFLFPYNHAITYVMPNSFILELGVVQRGAFAFPAPPPPPVTAAAISKGTPPET